MSRLKEKYLSRTELPEAKPNEIGLWGIAPILAVIAGGMILGIFILTLEKAYYVCKARRKSGFIKKPSDKVDVKLRGKSRQRNLKLQPFYYVV